MCFPRLRVTRVPILFLAAVLLMVPSLRAAGDKADPPVPVRTVAPETPTGFSKGGVPGLVTVGFTVDTKGGVQDAEIVKSSDQILNEPALTALKKWRFKPAQKDGQPVPMHVVVPIKFNIEE